MDKPNTTNAKLRDIMPSQLWDLTDDELRELYAAMPTESLLWLPLIAKMEQREILPNPTI